MIVLSLYRFKNKKLQLLNFRKMNNNDDIVLNSIKKELIAVTSRLLADEEKSQVIIGVAWLDIQLKKLLKKILGFD